jgi:hypothetical protein
MKRRDFLKSAAIALVPQINIRQSIDREALLGHFCSDECCTGCRYAMNRPFACSDGLAYATDSKIMARTQLTLPEIAGEARLPPALSTWQTHWHERSRWEEFELPPIEGLYLGANDVCPECPECFNRRVSFGPTYPKTHSQALEDYDYDCDDNTIRDRSCQRCHGKTYRGPWLVDMCGEHIPYSRAVKIASLPNVEICRGNDGIVLCRADGFEAMTIGVVRE